MKFLAVSSLDKIITIWNIEKRKVIITLDLTIGGIHTMVWWNSYQVLVTAGFENMIKVWQIDTVSLDATLIGKLTGHSSMICAIESIEGTPMLISADDTSHFKIWDIRNLKCIQTVKLDSKLSIHKLINLYDEGRLAFIGNRVNFIEFEKTSTKLNSQKFEEHVWPISVDFDENEDQIIICTQKDLRFLDRLTGRVIKIYKGLHRNEKSDSSVFKLIQQGKKFILGDDHGKINIYMTSTGELIKTLIPHANEVVSLEVDDLNKLIISCGIDSKINVHKEVKTTSEVMRSISNVYFNKGISQIEVSVYHNLILTRGNNNLIFVWDYEFVKLLACIQTPVDSEPVLVSILNNYPIIKVADTKGKIHFIKFKRKEVTHISFKTIGEIDISDGNPEVNNESCCFATKILVESQNSKDQTKISKLTMIISTNKGVIKIYDILDIINHPEVNPVHHANKRANYNCHRILEEDFARVVKNSEYYIHNIKQEDSLEYLILNKNLIKEFKAHNDSLSTLKIVNMSEKRLVSASLDSYIKIWTLEGDLLGSFNIKHPLPIMWNLDVDSSKKNRKKIYYALKVLEGVLKRYKSDMFFEEEKKISINNFLKKLQESSLESTFITSPKISFQNESNFSDMKERKKKVIVMADEYSALDFKSRKKKNVLQTSFQSPSLKQMDILKRITEVQKSMASKMKEDFYQEKEDEKRNEKRREEERQNRDFLNFLLDDSKKTSSMIMEREENKVIKELSEKLDQAVLNKRKPIRENDSETPKSSLMTSHKSQVTRRRGSFSRIISAQGTSSVSSSRKKPNSYSIKIDEIVQSPFSPKERGLLSGSMKQSQSTFLQGANTVTSNFFGSQTPQRKDFYLYAKRKMNLEGNKSLPSLLSNLPNSSLQKSVRTKEYERKLQKKSFCQILSQLEETKKRSRFTSSHFFKSSNRSTNTSDVKKSLLEKDNSCQIIPIKQFEFKEQTLLSYENFIDKQREVKGSKTFIQELGDFKEYVQDSWNLNLEEKNRKKSFFGKVLKKMVQKEEDNKICEVQEDLTNERDFTSLDKVFGATNIRKATIKKKIDKTWNP